MLCQRCDEIVGQSKIHTQKCKNTPAVEYKEQQTSPLGTDIEISS